jgi:hypothetical protein
VGNFIHTGDNRVKKQIQGKNKAKKQNFEKKMLFQESAPARPSVVGLTSISL